MTIDLSVWMSKFHLSNVSLVVALVTTRTTFWSVAEVASQSAKGADEGNGSFCLSKGKFRL